MTGLYIHIPFCLKKCGYCDFVSYTNQYDKIETYINAVCREMQEYRDVEIDTIYFGGGTPTSIENRYILKLMDEISHTFKVAPDSEITVECNPKTANLEYLKQMRAGGINRLSIGIQSLKDEELNFLGRLHDAEDARNSVYLAREAGFDNLNLDVMFGFPKQTMDDFLYSLHGIMDLEPKHISCYSLMIEQGTPFHKSYIAGELVPLEDNAERNIYKRAIDEMARCGFKMYEISNFALKGFESKHNLKYWDRVPYIGLGASAHSYFDGCRYENPESLEQYFKRVYEKSYYILEKTKLSRHDEMSEFMFLGLRKREGISQKEFVEQFQTDIFNIFGKTIQCFENLKLIEIDGDKIRLSLKGINVSNSIFSKFLLD